MYRDAFLWPQNNGFNPGSMEPKKMGMDIINNDAKTEVLKMVHESKQLNKDESFCVFDAGEVPLRYKLWKEAFPTIKPFYAVKVYDDPVVIKLLSELGAGFDCASKGEIELVQSLGVGPDDIVYANPIKIPSHISYAATKGVSLMTFDTDDELLKIKKCYPDARLLLRILPVGEEVAEFKMFSSFGATMEKIPTILSDAKKLNLSIVGVAFHVGSGFTDVEYFTTQIEIARKVFDMAAEQGFQMSILDIGGGFFGDKRAKSLLQMCGTINKSLEKLFPNVTVISEPGRFFVESALTLATCVVGRRNNSKKGTSDMGGMCISTSAFGVLNYGIVKSFVEGYRYHPKLILRNPTSPKTYDYTLLGPTCAPVDHIYCRDLPELQVGDWLIFEDVGAYTVPLAVSFNGIDPPPIRRVMENGLWKSSFCRTAHELKN